MNKFKNVSLLVLSGLSIHLLLIACSSGVGVLGGANDATTGNTPGLDSAHAQEAAAKCMQWEVKAAAPPQLRRLNIPEIAAGETVPTSNRNGLAADAFVVEAGWEPIGSYYESVLLRRCVK